MPEQEVADLETIVAGLEHCQKGYCRECPMFGKIFIEGQAQYTCVGNLAEYCISLIKEMYNNV